MKISVVIRTLNEEKYLDELLSSVENQVVDFADVEIVLVDSGSTDRTIEIAKRHACRIAYIDKSEFTFGRSLNIGCDVADGDFLVFVSGHCIPVRNSWLSELVRPLVDGKAVYSYGRQLGAESTKFSEHQLFEKYFGPVNQIPQEGYFCNNANAALAKSVWSVHRFDESVTGLEDMELAKRLVNAGEKIAYVADAPVHHIHDETWSQVRTRYERESYALRHIMPEVHLGLTDFLRFWLSGVLYDFGAALEKKKLHRYAFQIVAFRLMQYWGSYRGNHEHRKLSAELRERYFYPR